ncbi:MAG: hypothetical protein M5U01_03260 [Ardenticatenaceae bacterium]|nr:hypothetical protein [Ardenticatenaceae bacterium]HBY93392.1 hypothetical protein [Chloroflexota bacterium]
MERVTQTERYWRDKFRLTDEDRDNLLESFITKATPLSTDAIARFLMNERYRAEERVLAARVPANAYQPAGHYQVGDHLVFAALGGGRGEVVGARDGYNPRYDHFTVITVQIEDEAAPREFVTEFKHPHALNLEMGAAQEEQLSPEELYERYGFYVRQKLEQEMAGSDEFVRFGDRWLPTALMVQYNVGHLNIADAMIDITREPLPPRELLKEIGEGAGVAMPIREFSLNYALSQDSRFVNVGTDERPLWSLGRLQ